MIFYEHREYAIFFAGLILILLFFLFLMQWKKKARKRMGDLKLVNELTREFSPGLFLVKYLLPAIAFALLVIAVINPRKPGAASEESRKGIDLAIALDVSKSMLAADLPPNRLERAKQFLAKLIDQMPDDRIALILFAGKAYMQMPLTTDHGATKLFISTASPNAVGEQGTVISEALTMSANVFNAKERRFKSMLLISDGEDHDEDAITKAKELAGEGVMINTVGIGSAEGSTIPDPLTGDVKKDENGNPVVSILNEAELKSIADATNGVYTRLETSDAAVKVIKAQLSQIEKKAFTDISQMNFITYYMWFAGFALLLLIVELFIPERKKRIA